ncbi:MAG: hypothetical protein OEY36_06910 [Gammaproteobacteria bacterium]|nr:hypothetical protein [Gammaproteobacteria bacterium]
MKILGINQFISLAVLLLMAAGSQAETSYDLYLKSNQMFLEDTVKSLNIESIVSKVIPKTSALVLRNIEEEGTTDKKIIALIEDQLIANLVSSGYKVLERDENAIRRALEEKSAANNFSIINKIISPKVNALPAVVNAELKKGDNSIQIEGVSLQDSSKHMVKTHLLGASYIINYRIQELGINYTDSIITKDLATRSSIVRLHLRIEEASSGRILMAETVVSTKNDLLTLKMMKQLSDYRYSQFYNSYPTHNDDENNIYKYSTRKGFIEYAVVTSQQSVSKVFAGIKTSDMYFGYEQTSLTSDMDGTPLINDFSMIVAGSQLGSIKTLIATFNVMHEYGIGPGNMQIEDNNAVETSDSLALKAALSLQTELFTNFRAKLGAEVFIGEAGAIENVYASIGYDFN